MNLAKFGNLISYITMISNRNGAQVLPINDIDELGKIIVDMMPSTEIDLNVWVKRSEVSNEVDNMMRAMRDGEKIPAIKACRSLTGLGLKDAKDMVDMVMHREVKANTVPCN